MKNKTREGLLKISGRDDDSQCLQVWDLQWVEEHERVQVSCPEVSLDVQTLASALVGHSSSFHIMFLKPRCRLIEGNDKEDNIIIDKLQRINYVIWEFKMSCGGVKESLHSSFKSKVMFLWVFCQIIVNLIYLPDLEVLSALHSADAAITSGICFVRCVSRISW